MTLYNSQKMYPLPRLNYHSRWTIPCTASPPNKTGFFSSTQTYIAKFHHLLKNLATSYQRVQDPVLSFRVSENINKHFLERSIPTLNVFTERRATISILASRLTLYLPCACIYQKPCHKKYPVLKNS